MNLDVERDNVKNEKEPDLSNIKNMIDENNLLNLLNKNKLRFILFIYPLNHDCPI